MMRCEGCPDFKWYGVTVGFYCEKLKHPLENGYAMESHSKMCGYEPKKECKEKGLEVDA